MYINIYVYLIEFLKNKVNMKQHLDPNYSYETTKTVVNDFDNCKIVHYFVDLNLYEIKI